MSADNLGPPGNEEGPGLPTSRAQPQQTTHTTTGHRQESQRDNPNAASGSGGNGEVTTGYAAAFNTYHRLSWPSALPLPRGAKKNPPTGYTGHDGIDPSYADMMTWAEQYPDGNLALRLPPDVIGIDVDQYDDKEGRATLEIAEKTWGALPPTYRSTSRIKDFPEFGCVSAGVSGIRLFRVPAGTRLRQGIAFPEHDLPAGYFKMFGHESPAFKTGGIEIIQHHHRYVMCWPSIHPSGEPYRWIAEIDHSVMDTPPGYADIPELPQAWLEALTEPEPNQAHNGTELGSENAYNVNAAITEGEMSQRVAFKLGEALSELYGPACRHDEICKRVLGLLRCGKQGEPGVKRALLSLREAFVNKVGPDRPGGRGEAVGEFNDFVTGKRVGTLLADTSYDDETASAATDDKGDAAPLWQFVDGASFILDIPPTIPALWGEGQDVLWADGESLMIAGPMGLGKTTLGLRLLRARLGLGDDTLLGYPVAPCEGNILYLAMDRPAQIARAAYRMFNEEEREILRGRVKFWPGPPPVDLAKQPGILTALAEAADAAEVYLDSVKDAAIGLSEDEVGAGYNRARQQLLATGRQLAEMHHTTKRGQGGGPPTAVADIYGSAWITNGTGSIVLLAGEPGDPIVGFRHVRAPANELGPFRLLHDQAAGEITVYHSADLVALAAASGIHGLSIKDAAGVMFSTSTPTDAQKEKARRKLAKLVADGLLQKVEGTADGHGGAAPCAWFATDGWAK